MLAIEVAGGVALFLLAMSMMTDGLKTFAGGGLKQLLGRWTSSPLRGVLAGVLVTGIVQSSSAVTVAAIGFVNAGLLSLRQALGVIYGTNVGTTMTGWLVSLVGFGFRVEFFALPILTAGVGLRLLAPGRRHQGLGDALAGFGLFFLGLAVLKEAFAALAADYGAGLAGGVGVPASWSRWILAGAVATVLTQSSSAAIAIILTAAAGGVVGFEAAAAAVIGANLGTTSTAVLATLRATPAARRLALGHIAFNVIAAMVALALLTPLLALVRALADWFDVEGSPAAVLALFHTVFNVLGVLVMLPLSGQLARFLERLFCSAEEDIARPRHLDSTLRGTPALAAAALREELLRLRGIVLGIAGAALGELTAPSAGQVEIRARAVRALGEAIATFVGSVRTAGMTVEVGAELTEALRSTRYLLEAARLMPALAGIRARVPGMADEALRAALGQVVSTAGACVALAARQDGSEDTGPSARARLGEFKAAYRQAKASALGAAVAGTLAVEEADDLLDALSAARRCVEQLVKGDRALQESAGKAIAMDGEMP